MWLCFVLKKEKILTIVPIKTSPNKLVVVCDLVHDSTKTAHTVLHNLGSTKGCIRTTVSHDVCGF